MGGAQSSDSAAFDDEKFLPDDSFHLIPFSQRTSTSGFVKERQAAEKTLQHLSKKVSQSDTDAGAVNPERWMGICRQMMLLNLDKVVLTPPGDDTTSSSSEEEEDDEETDVMQRGDTRQSSSSSHSTATGRSTQRKKKKAEEVTVTGTVIGIVDCARIAVLRSGEQDGHAWRLLGEVLLYVQRRNRIAAVSQDAASSSAAPPPPAATVTCTINGKTYTAYETFSKAWWERGEESAYRSMLRLEALSLLSSLAMMTAAAAAGPSSGVFGVDGNSSNAIAASHLSPSSPPPQLKEVVDKIVTALQETRCQPALWFVLGQLLEATAKLPSASSSMQLLHVSYEDRVKRAKKNNTCMVVDSVDSLRCLCNVLECDPRDAVVWYYVISKVWPSIARDPFAAATPTAVVLPGAPPLSSPPPPGGSSGSPLALTLNIGHETLPLAAAVVRALEADHCYGTDAVLEALIFSATRGAVAPIAQRQRMMDALHGAFGRHMEEMACCVLDGLVSTVSFFPSLIATTLRVTRPTPRQRQQRQLDTEGEVFRLFLEPHFAVSKKKSLVGLAVGGEEYFDCNNEISVLIAILKRWPRRPVLWRYLGAVLCRRDEVKYREYLEELIVQQAQRARAMLRLPTTTTTQPDLEEVRSSSQQQQQQQKKKKKSAGECLPSKKLSRSARYLQAPNGSPLTTTMTTNNKNMNIASSSFFEPETILLDGVALTATDCLLTSAVLLNNLKKQASDDAASRKEQQQQQQAEPRQDEDEALTWYSLAQCLRRYDINPLHISCQLPPRVLPTNVFGPLTEQWCLERVLSILLRDGDAATSSGRNKEQEEDNDEVTKKSLCRIAQFGATVRLAELSRATRLGAAAGAAVSSSSSSSPDATSPLPSGWEERLLYHLASTTLQDILRRHRRRSKRGGVDQQQQQQRDSTGAVKSEVGLLAAHDKDEILLLVDLIFCELEAPSIQQQQQQLQQRGRTTTTMAATAAARLNNMATQCLALETAAAYLFSDEWMKSHVEGNEEKVEVASSSSSSSSSSANNNSEDEEDETTADDDKGYFNDPRVIHHGHRFFACCEALLLKSNDDTSNNVSGADDGQTTAATSPKALFAERQHVVDVCNRLLQRALTVIKNDKKASSVFQTHMQRASFLRIVPRMELMLLRNRCGNSNNNSLDKTMTDRDIVLRCVDEFSSSWLAEWSWIAEVVVGDGNKTKDTIHRRHTSYEAAVSVIIVAVFFLHVQLHPDGPGRVVTATTALSSRLLRETLWKGFTSVCPSTMQNPVTLKALVAMAEASTTAEMQTTLRSDSMLGFSADVLRAAAALVGAAMRGGGVEGLAEWCRPRLAQFLPHQREDDNNNNNVTSRGANPLAGVLSHVLHGCVIAAVGRVDPRSPFSWGFPSLLPLPTAQQQQGASSCPSSLSTLCAFVSFESFCVVSYSFARWGHCDLTLSLWNTVVAAIAEEEQGRALSGVCSGAAVMMLLSSLKEVLQQWLRWHSGSGTHVLQMPSSVVTMMGRGGTREEGGEPFPHPLCSVWDATFGLLCASLDDNEEAAAAATTSQPSTSIQELGGVVSLLTRSELHFTALQVDILCSLGMRLATQSSSPSSPPILSLQVDRDTILVNLKGVLHYAMSQQRWEPHPWMCVTAVAGIRSTCRGGFLLRDYVLPFSSGSSTTTTTIIHQQLDKPRQPTSSAVGTVLSMHYFLETACAICPSLPLVHPGIVGFERWRCEASGALERCLLSDLAVCGRRVVTEMPVGVVAWWNGDKRNGATTTAASLSAFQQFFLREGGGVVVMTGTKETLREGALRLLWSI